MFWKYISFLLCVPIIFIQKREKALIPVSPWNISLFSFFENILFTWFCISCVHVANSPSRVTSLSVCQQCRDSIYLTSVSRRIFRDAMSSFHPLPLLIKLLLSIRVLFRSRSLRFSFALHLLTIYVNHHRSSSIRSSLEKTGFIFTSIIRRLRRYLSML